MVAAQGNEAIVIDGVSKTFRLANDPIYSLKERLLRLGRKGHEDFVALRPMSITIDQGSTVGILGHNGSGKSTLLKCIAGILTPTTGSIRLRGRLASLLELGAGFHPELTGRENVYINAAFLGIPRREIARRFDDIVAFSELETFIDEPVKHYSSGMYVRLGFAVAVNVDPDILLVDEVLAVGDEVFQKKCIDRVREFQREGRTIVVVTHAADTVRQVCDRAIVLDHGELVADGKPGESIRIFREHLHGNLQESEPDSPERGDSPLVITAVDLHHDADQTRRYLLTGERLEVRVSYETSEPIEDALIGMDITDDEGEILYSIDSDRLECPLPSLRGAGQITLAIDRIPLLDGEYPVNVRISDRRHARLLDWREGAHRFEVVNPGRAEGRVALDVSLHTSSRESVGQPPLN